MAKTKITTASVPFAFVKAGVFYFSRRVPRDLQHRYTSNRVSYSLKTRSPVVAASRATRAAQQLDQFWYHLRLEEADLPGKHLIRQALIETSNVSTAPSSNLFSPPSAAVSLSEAVSLYLRLKGRGRPVTFQRAAERACGYVIDVCGDKAINQYTKSNANRFRDDLIERKLAGSSITRILGTVRSVINFAASESGIDFNNPFSKLYYDRNAGVSDRQPVATEALHTLQRECMKQDDELRWLVALISDTGMRLAEAAGLTRDDLRLDAPIPHMIVQEHPWRRLKTAGSNRKIPLVGASLWAAERIVTQTDASPFAFPRYTTRGLTNANSASAALNKWMKPFVPEKTTVHSFRHSMRDRLRAVECPADIVDQIGGWQTEGVGHGYGKGYPLEVLAKWMNAVT